MLAVAVAAPDAPLSLGRVVAALLIVAETLLLYPLTRVASAGVLGGVYLLGVLIVAIGWGFWLAAATSRLSPGDNVGTVSIPTKGGPGRSTVTG